MYAEVVFPLPFRNSFTYKIPKEFEEQVQLGVRVVCSFGRRVLTGFVINVTETTKVKDKVKSLSDVLDAQPIFSKDSLKFYKWIAEYYMSSLGESLKNSVPYGLDVESKKKIVADKELCLTLFAKQTKPNSIKAKLLKLLSEKEIYSIKQLQKLSSDKLIGISFSEEIKIKMNIKETLSFKERVKALHSLPPMPETASQILTLRSIPDVKVEQIVEVIEKDPILVAQIVSYANSAFFGQAGSVKSLKDAIFRVLGVDAVMNMALALSVGSTFKIPKVGPVGAKAIWRSSVYAASLMQRLSMLMPWGKRPNPGTAYLVGLLNDIGLLVLGHLFTEEYIELNNYLEQNENINVLEAEQHVFGISHLEVGKMVMRMWNMPDELITVATYFNDKDSSDEHEKYIELLTVVKTLLVPHGLAFGNSSEELPLYLLEALSLDEEDVIIAADEVLSEGEIIKNLVKQMCA